MYWCAGRRLSCRLQPLCCSIDPWRGIDWPLQGPLRRFLASCSGFLLCGVLAGTQGTAPRHCLCGHDGPSAWHAGRHGYCFLVRMQGRPWVSLHSLKLARRLGACNAAWLGEIVVFQRILKPGGCSGTWSLAGVACVATVCRPYDRWLAIGCWHCLVAWDHCWCEQCSVCAAATFCLRRCVEEKICGKGNCSCFKEEKCWV